MTRKISALALLGTILLLSSCASSARVPPDPVGGWGTDGPGQPNLVLEANGKLHGTDGCNRLVGSYEASGTDITFGPLGGTRMFCEGVDTWLSNAAGGTLGADTLEITDAQGQRIGTLERMP
ncbi:META domain-containing protein [Paeniglutamicibacter psychrophenolicus]|uniref:Heat shock protein HslJ n=1 Tax=Paeniglutamicibacter psychrophenolicus TaxID=257454 RepID=A0ABS4WBG6_9MICC|nr:META domain-containing protein [Paeniglutamicibacter psychrophenolicus]MBP2373549.1 heat shock protein HslJ [Paeniglutamicibacter psychrophenolicus]